MLHALLPVALRGLNMPPAGNFPCRMYCNIFSFSLFGRRILEIAEAGCHRPCALLSVRSASKLIGDQFLNASFGERAPHDAQLPAARHTAPTNASAHSYFRSHWFLRAGRQKGADAEMSVPRHMSRATASGGQRD